MNKRTKFFVFYLSIGLLFTTFCTSILAEVQIEFGQIFGVGKRASTIGSGDLNGDGYVDLAVANIFSDSLSLAFNDGSGSFTQFQEIPLENDLKHPVALSVGDLDGDGRDDIAAAQVQNIESTIIPFNTSSVIFFFSNEDGTYTQMSKEVRGVPSSVIIHDVDGDGLNDVVVGNNGETAFDFAQSGSIIQIDTGIDLVTNWGDRMFSDPSPVDIEGSVVNEVAFDYNNDGYEDVVGVNQGVPEINPLTLDLTVKNPNISLFRGTPSGITAFTTISLEYPPWSLDLEDIDGDGLQDIAVTLVGKSDPNNFLSFLGEDASVQIFTNTGAGFSLFKEVPVTGVAYSVLANDFDMDDDTDLIVSGQEIVVRVEGNELIPKLRLYENDGDNNFTEVAVLDVEEEPRFALADDFDQDGDLDLAILCTIIDADKPMNAVNGQVYIFYNKIQTAVADWQLY